MPKPAQATPSVGTGASSTTAIINKIINSTPGLNKVVIGSSGVSVVASGETAVAARGIVVPIGAEATAAVSAGRIAGIVAKGIKVGSWVGVATVVAPWIMDQAGIKVCPPPDFFCKAGPDIGVTPTTGGYILVYNGKALIGGTADQVCQMLFAAYSPSQQSGVGSLKGVFVTPNNVWVCRDAKGGNVATVDYSTASCPAGSTKKGNDCVKAGPDVAASEGDVGQSLEDAMIKVPSRMGTAFAGLQSVNAPIWSSTDPVTVKPVSATVAAPVETRTETIPKADGSVDTVKTEVKTEVKPVVTGTNLGDTKVDYPTTITTTTTTTNNVTNVTTTTTNVTNIYATPEPKTRDNPPDPGPPPPIPQSPADAIKGPELKIPDDYNREGTQQKVLAKLEEGFGKITAEVPKGDDELKAIKDQNDKGVAAVDGITEASMGFKGWFPSIPTATCVNPTVSSYTGDVREVAICDKVSIFQTFISAVVCVFAVFGCAREIQSALKA